METGGAGVGAVFLSQCWYHAVSGIGPASFGSPQRSRICRNGRVAYLMGKWFPSERRWERLV